MSRRLEVSLQQSSAWLSYVLKGPLGLLAVSSAFFLPMPSNAQVFDPGPSDPSLFDTVISLPPDPNILNDASIGGVTGQATQLNVLDGGSVGLNFTSHAGSEVNISGGEIGRRKFGDPPSVFNANFGSEVNISSGGVYSTFAANAGSLVNISGGSAGSLQANSESEVTIRGGRGSVDANSNSMVSISGGEFGLKANANSVVSISGGEVNIFADFGSMVNISGGVLGQGFIALTGSDVELIGGEYMLNGVPYSDSSVSLLDGDVFTGTLADGSAFIFAEEASDFLDGVTLIAAQLPLLETTPIVIDAGSP